MERSPALQRAAQRHTEYLTNEHELKAISSQELVRNLRSRESLEYAGR